MQRCELPFVKDEGPIRLARDELEQQSGLRAGGEESRAQARVSEPTRCDKSREDGARPRVLLAERVILQELTDVRDVLSTLLDRASVQAWRFRPCQLGQQPVHLLIGRVETRR